MNQAVMNIDALQEVAQEIDKLKGQLVSMEAGLDERLISLEAIFDKTPTPRVQKAMKFLEAFLSERGRTKSQVMEARLEAGISQNAVYLAGKELGVIHTKNGRWIGPSYWVLPE